PGGISLPNRVTRWSRDRSAAGSFDVHRLDCGLSSLTRGGCVPAVGRALCLVGAVVFGGLRRAGSFQRGLARQLLVFGHPARLVALAVLPRIAGGINAAAASAALALGGICW